MFETLSQEEEQVFQQDQSPIELTLAGIMRELADIKMAKATPHLFHPFVDSALGG